MLTKSCGIKKKAARPFFAPASEVSTYFAGGAKIISYNFGPCQALFNTLFFVGAFLAPGFDVE